MAAAADRRGEAAPYTRPIDLAHKTTDGRRIRPDLAMEPDLAIASILRHREGKTVLRDVPSDENFAAFHQVLPSWCEASLADNPR